MIDTKPDNAYGPFGSTSRTAGPKRLRRIEMHDNPGATDEEQELSQTERMHDEEQQRSYSPAEATDEDEDESED
jgi:hypothetical protein